MTEPQIPIIGAVMRRFTPIPVVLAAVVAVTGCSTTVSGTPLAASTAAARTTAPDVSANRALCVDFDARGGALYNVFVVPMMAGASGQKSINVDEAQLSRATGTLADLETGSINDASPEIRDQAERLAAAAKALGMYDHAEGTALLTAFVSLGVACQKEGLKPSWFDAKALVS